MQGTFIFGKYLPKISAFLKKLDTFVSTPSEKDWIGLSHITNWTDLTDIFLVQNQVYVSKNKSGYIDGSPLC